MTCNASRDLHVGDVGTEIEVTLYDTLPDGSQVVVDISAATAIKIRLKKPSGDVIERDGQLKTDGTDGVAQYFTVEDDLDEAGEWQIQANVALPPAGRWSSCTDEFSVARNL